MFHLKDLIRLLLLVIASLGFADAVRAMEPFEAFLTKHCLHCHGPDSQEGELHIDRLSRDFKLGGQAHRWAEVIERVNSGEMPPESELQPTQDEIAAFVTKLDSLIKEGQAARMAIRGPILDVTKQDGEVPLGSSGIPVRIKVDLVLDGFRPGKIVRIRPMNWPADAVPREEYTGGREEERFPSPDIFPKD